MGNVRNNEFFVALSFIANPENPSWVSFHVLNVFLGILILILRIAECEACFYSLHKRFNKLSSLKFARVVPVEKCL